MLHKTAYSLVLDPTFSYLATRDFLVKVVISSLCAIHFCMCPRICNHLDVMFLTNVFVFK